MKTLYVSDLDGTLLNSNQRTTEYTNKILNELIKKGLCFSYATARSYHTSHKVTEGLTAAFPLIVYNGAFIKDNMTGEMLLTNFFDRLECISMIKELVSWDINPIVYALIGGEEKFSYMEAKINTATKAFIATRTGDSRDNPVQQPEGLLQEEIFYITCIDKADKLASFYDKYKDNYHCVYAKDIYTDEQWLEIMPKKASKANAIKQLAEILNCDYIVVFGDGINDIDMFEIADEAYAVENAVPKLKEIATGIIESNDSDGVVKWLNEHCNSMM